MVVREGRIVTKVGTPKRGQRGAADDMTDLMKRDGWLHLIEVEVKCRWRSLKIEVEQEYQLDVQMETNRRVGCEIYWM